MSRCGQCVLQPAHAPLWRRCSKNSGHRVRKEEPMSSSARLGDSTHQHKGEIRSLPALEASAFSSLSRRLEELEGQYCALRLYLSSHHNMHAGESQALTMAHICRAA
ncbi:hypothetical protein MN608_03947 [Microdochium nivale]|nr:hypothetical protein MN608_03947 [Microdochium nivale]